MNLIFQFSIHECPFLSRFHLARCFCQQQHLSSFLWLFLTVNLAVVSINSGCCGLFEFSANQLGPVNHKDPSLSGGDLLVPRTLGFCADGTYFLFEHESSCIFLTRFRTNVDLSPRSANQNSIVRLSPKLTLCFCG